MPPKARITKDNIIEASLSIIRKEGLIKLNARAVAKILGCSTQPIFSYYATMSELKEDAIHAARNYCGEYFWRRIKNAEAPYQASGLAYIQLAKEEKEIFKLFFMSDDENARMINDNIHNEIKRIREATGFSEETARKFHMHMWIFVHGIATLFVTSYMDISDELVVELVGRVYRGTLAEFEKETDNYECQAN